MAYHFNMYRNLKNHLDFYLRKKLSFKLTLPQSEATHPLTKKLQGEMSDFLNLFDWSLVLKEIKLEKHLIIADVGTRTFSIAPVLDQHFREYNPEIHGIEIDAYRRFTNFYSRADYGNYYASQIPRGFFHAADFLKWSRELHIVSMLHPFVTKEPLLNWGLPLSAFQPEMLFRHAYNLLEKQKGVILVSSPDEEEFKVSKELTLRAGFKIIQEAQWIPHKESTQRQPRFGMLASI